MKKGLNWLWMVGLLALTACGNKQTEKVNYREAEGYFVRNDAVRENTAKKINSPEEFNKYFGQAATMSKRPTEMDFSKDFVAAIILDETDVETRISVDSIIWNGARLGLYYSVIQGSRQSYSTRPSSILIIDRKYEGPLDIIANDPSGNMQRAGSHNSRNSLDYEGTYAGTIPCADCEGIEVVISLDRSGTYTKKMTYLGKGPDNVFTSSGEYEWDAAGGNITLIGGESEDIYKVGENRLIMLDKNGKTITGDLAQMYILKKK